MVAQQELHPSSSKQYLGDHAPRATIKAPIQGQSVLAFGFGHVIVSPMPDHRDNKNETLQDRLRKELSQVTSMLQEAFNENGSNEPSTKAVQKLAQVVSSLVNKLD